MAHRLLIAVAAMLLLSVTACNLFPPTGPSEINTRLGADGRVRQFFLTPASSGPLNLGNARNLMVAVSTGAVPSRAGSFRIQGPPDPGAISDPHTRFRESSRAIAQEGDSLPMRLQNVEPPPKLKDVRNFWINTGNSQTSGDVQRQAELLIAPTKNAYFFVDTGSALMADRKKVEAQVAELASIFESRIHPRISQAFGGPPSPGVDGDPRIYVVISPAVDDFGSEQGKGLMGYFWSRDLTDRPNSNRKEVIFLTDQIFKHKEWTRYGTLAHEYTHLVVYNQKVLAPNRSTAEETWLDEGLAMLAMDLCGFGLKDGNEEIARDIARFQAEPDLFSLTDWFRNPKGFSYGLSYLFTRYLYDRFEAGGIRNLLMASQVGVAGVEQVLSPRGIRFEELYSDWSIANAISGMGLTSDPRYSYAPEINLRKSYGTVHLKGVQPRPLAGSADVTGPTRPWGTAYYLFTAQESRAWTMEVRPGLGLFGGSVALQ